MEIPKLVMSAPVKRPQFDNRCIDVYPAWVTMNAVSLACYWRLLGEALSFHESDEDEYRLWLRVQWDIQRELIEAKRHTPPHRDSL